MSEFQRARALASIMQKEKDAALAREKEAKQLKERQAAKEAEEKRRRVEEALKEARRQELLRKHQVLKAKESSVPSAAHDSLKTGQAMGDTRKTVAVVDYDPFAEDEYPRPVVHAVKKAAAKSKANSATLSKTTNTGSDAKIPNRKAKADVSQDLDLTRKERSAQVFKIKASKPNKSDSIFSIRALVEGRAGSSPQPSHNNAQLLSTQAASRPQQNSRTTKIVKASKHDAELIPLCKNKATRDLRTIDEIQRDIKARKAGSSNEAAAQSVASSGSVSPARPAVRASGKPKMKVPIPSSARPTHSASSRGESSRSVSPAKVTAPTTKPKIAIPSSGRPIATSNPPHKRNREDSYETESETSEDEVASRKRSKHRATGGRQREWEKDEPSREFISAQIQDLFRRPGRGPPRPVVYSDDEDDSDMEAGVMDMEAEERAAARIARLEDEMEDRKERERKMAKELLKRTKATQRA